MDKHSIPKEIGGLPVVRWSPIDTRHRVTGACRHFDLSKGTEDPVPAIVAIVGRGPNFYLMRFDNEWQFITDTWHESLDGALAQAEFEYEGISNTWCQSRDEPAEQ